MNVLVLFGSPRKKGNTASAVGWLEDELMKKGHEVEQLNLAFQKLSACHSCFKCMAAEGFTCVQKDDANSIFEKMAVADAVVLATPLYFWSFSAQTKLLVDRMISQVKNYGSPKQTSSVKGKPMAMLVTCWGPIEDNSEIITQLYGRLADYLVADNKGYLVVPECTPQGDMPGDAEEQVRAFAAKL